MRNVCRAWVEVLLERWSLRNNGCKSYVHGRQVVGGRQASASGGSEKRRSVGALESYIFVV